MKHFFGVGLVAVAMVVPGASVSELHLSAAPQRNTTDFTYWCVGNCSATTATPALPATERVRKGGVVLMGGGTDTDDGFRQMIDWSDDGNFLVIRAYGDDAYNQYIDDLGKGRLSSVATLLTKSRNASVSGMRWLLSRHDLLQCIRGSATEAAKHRSSCGSYVFGSKGARRCLSDGG